MDGLDSKSWETIYSVDTKFSKWKLTQCYNWAMNQRSRQKNMESSRTSRCSNIIYLTIFQSRLANQMTIIIKNQTTNGSDYLSWTGSKMKVSKEGIQKCWVKWLLSKLKMLMEWIMYWVIILWKFTYAITQYTIENPYSIRLLNTMISIILSVPYGCLSIC